MEHLQNCIYNISVKLPSWRQIQSGWWRSPATSTGRVPLAAWFGPLRIRVAEVGVKWELDDFKLGLMNWWTERDLTCTVSTVYSQAFDDLHPSGFFVAKHGRMKPWVVACHVGPMNQGISPSLDRRIKKVTRRLAPQHAPFLQLLQQQTCDFQTQTKIVIG